MLNSCSFSKSEPYFGDIDQTDLCMILCLFLSQGLEYLISDVHNDD